MRSAVSGLGPGLRVSKARPPTPTAATTTTTTGHFRITKGDVYSNPLRVGSSKGFGSGSSDSGRRSRGLFSYAEFEPRLLWKWHVHVLRRRCSFSKVLASRGLSFELRIREFLQLGAFTGIFGRRTVLLSFFTGPVFLKRPFKIGVLAWICSAFGQA